MVQRRITSHDVAKLAGVSQSTVSRVISEKPGANISDETRQRVLEAVRQLDYHPSAAARSLVRQQTRALGLIVREDPDRQTTNTFSPLVIEGVASTTRLNGFKLLVEAVPDNTPPDVYFNLVNEGHVDGIILTAARPDDVKLIQLHANRVPVVVWGKIPGNIPFVDVDNEGAAKMAVEHLIALGHKRIACIAFGPPDHIGPADRVRGYRAAMEAHNLAYDDTLIRYAHFDESSGFEAMSSLLTLPERPTAIFVASDEVAIGALQAATSASLRVPDDIALVGFDDVPIARRVTPSLTTVRLPIRELGVAAAQMLIDMIQTGQQPASRILETTLVVRESSGAPTQSLETTE